MSGAIKLWPKLTGPGLAIDIDIDLDVERLDLVQNLLERAAAAADIVSAVGLLAHGTALDQRIAAAAEEYKITPAMRNRLSSAGTNK